MTVAELLSRIIAAYPGATPEALKTFKPVFYARLQKHEGEALEAASIEVLGSFRPKFDQKFPIPADFEAQLPSGKLKFDKDAGPRLDLEGHSTRYRALMGSWREGQGKRGARGIPEVLRALEYVAEPLAYQNAWHPNPRPVLLTKEHLKLAQHRAISQQRRVEHGQPPKSADAWWDQISAIAERWAIQTVREEWTSDSPAKPEPSRMEAAE